MRARAASPGKQSHQGLACAVQCPCAKEAQGEPMRGVDLEYMGAWGQP